MLFFHIVHCIFHLVQLLLQLLTTFIVFFLLSPPDAGAEHLKALAAVSRALRHAPTLEKLRGAGSRDALAAVLMGVDERDAA